MPKKPPTWMIVGAGAVGALVLFVVIIFSSLNGIQSEGVARESKLTARYLANQNTRSKMVNEVKEKLGVADRKSDRFDEILTNAVSGRYGDNLTVETPGEGGKNLMSMLVEAYPDISAGVNGYDEVMIAISSGRAAFKADQDVLLDEIAAYKTWRDSGILHSKMVSWAGFTSDRLEARIGDKVLRGDAALEQMQLIVTSADNNTTFGSGTDPGIDTNPGNR